MIGIVGAFEQEIGYFLTKGAFKITATAGSLKYYQSQSMSHIVVVSGAVGKEKAQRATSELIERFRPNQIVSAGFGGALNGSSKTGDIFICDRLIAVEDCSSYWNASRSKEHSIRESPIGISNYVELGTCVTVPKLASSRYIKEWLGITFQANVVDMESYWVCETAAEYQVGHIVVRSMFDEMKQDLPEFMGTLATGIQASPVRDSLRHIVTKPEAIPGMIRLAYQTKAASRSLAKILFRISEELK